MLDVLRNRFTPIGIGKKKNTVPSKIFYQDVARLQGYVGFGVKSY